MEWLKYTALGLAAVCIVIGLLGLTMACLWPKSLDGPLMRWMLTGPHLDPTRRNRLLMSLSSLLMGVYIVLSINRQIAASLVVLAAWAPFAIGVHRAAREARRASLRASAQ